MVSNDLIEIWWNVFILAHFISEFFFVLVEVPKESLAVSKCILTTYLIVREWFHTYLIIFSKIMITFKYCLICTKKRIFIETIYLCIFKECMPNPCLNNGYCQTESSGNLRCYCPQGFWGMLCENGICVFLYWKLPFVNTYYFE